jgi:hypothetical protein
MSEHTCIKEGFLGEVKEFMNSIKGFRTTLATMALAIVLQVGTFLFLWGGLTTTVNKNSDQIWNKLTPVAERNATNIEKILTKLDAIKFVYAVEKEENEHKK